MAEAQLTGRPSAADGPGAAVTGKVVLVSGASSGIGLATAHALAGAGAIVHGLSRRTLGNAGFEEHACDITEPAAVADVVRDIARPQGLDAMVASAGTNIRDRRLDRLSIEGWDEVVTTNLSGSFYLFRAVLPHLRTSRGSAIFVSSVSGMWPDASGAAYQASKAGVIGLARAAAVEEHGNGVRVSVVMPGLVATPLLEKRPVPPDEAQLAGALRPEDVAATCVWLLSLPARAYVPEVTILPAALQALGASR